MEFQLLTDPLLRKMKGKINCNHNHNNKQKMHNALFNANIFLLPLVHLTRITASNPIFLVK